MFYFGIIGFAFIIAGLFTGTYVVVEWFKDITHVLLFSSHGPVYYIRTSDVYFQDAQRPYSNSSQANSQLIQERNKQKMIGSLWFSGHPRFLSYTSQTFSYAFLFLSGSIFNFFVMLFIFIFQNNSQDNS